MSSATFAGPASHAGGASKTDEKNDTYAALSSNTTSTVVVFHRATPASWGRTGSPSVVVSASKRGRVALRSDMPARPPCGSK